MRLAVSLSRLSRLSVLVEVCAASVAAASEIIAAIIHPGLRVMIASTVLCEGVDVQRRIQPAKNGAAEHCMNVDCR
jgi:hypothetical protein